MKKPSSRTAADRKRELAAWVDEARAHADMNQAELSRALVQAGLTSVDRAAVSKVIKGERVLKAEEMLEVSRICDYPTPDWGARPRPAASPTGHPAGHAFGSALSKAIER
jgi:hypothetical protein